MVEVTKVLGPVCLLVASCIWGVAFSAQSEGMKYLPPAFFNCLRSIVGSFALFWVSCIFSGNWRHFWRGWGNSQLMKGGFACGICIVFASVFQQIGICYNTAGKSGFLTSLYIVFVPIVGMLLFHRKTQWVLWISVLLSTYGMYLLCTPSGALAMNIGDWSLLASAVSYAFHILVIDYYVARVDCVKLSCVQFLWNAVFSFIASLLLGEMGRVTIAGIKGGMMPMLFCGIFSSGIAFTLQMVGQKYVHPVAATLLMCLESVFAVIGGWIVLGERLAVREYIGCSVIFAAVILAQISPMIMCKKEVGQ